MKRAVFLDRDGTICQDRGYQYDPAAIDLLPGAAEALQALRSAGFALVLISNQSGIARGYFTIGQLEEFQQALNLRLSGFGLKLDGEYYCPHLPQAPLAEYELDCECRKPRPGMIHRAARELGLDPCRSFMIGDKESDMQAGRQAGCRTVRLISSGEPGAAAVPPSPETDFVANSWADAVQWILRPEGK